MIVNVIIEMIVESMKAGDAGSIVVDPAHLLRQDATVCVALGAGLQIAADRNHQRIEMDVHEGRRWTFTWGPVPNKDSAGLYIVE